MARKRFHAVVEFNNGDYLHTDIFAESKQEVIDYYLGKSFTFWAYVENLGMECEDKHTAIKLEVTEIN